VLGQREVLLALCDIDDGTVDGNTRVDPVTGQLVTDEDADGNGMAGDGFVDMRDFRRFRDWLLLAQGKAGGLDGGADHPKRDLNRDGLVEDPGVEYHPRADFNGDRQLHATKTALVPGHIGGMVTDLEVLMAAFEDEHYAASELPGLLESGDIRVDLDECFANPDVAEVHLELTAPGAPPEERLALPNESHREVRTFALGDYEVVIEARDASGSVLTEAQVTLTIEQAGQDLRYAPNCGGPVGGWLVERLDITGARQLNDAGQVLGVVLPGLWWAVLEPDGSVTDLDDDESWRLSPSGPVRVGDLTAGLDNPDYTCPLMYMDTQTVSPSGVRAGRCGQQGTPAMAWIKADVGLNGPATEVLATHTHQWLRFSVGSPFDPWVTNDHAINDAGLWVGAAEPDFDATMVPAILSGPEPQWLPLPAGYDAGTAEIVNAGGTIAGVVRNTGDGSRALAFWGGDSPRVVETDHLDDWWGPILLSDEGTLVGACDVASCFYVLPAGADELERFPETLDVEEDDGSITTHMVNNIQDTNGLGQLLVTAEDVDGLESTLLVSPR
jgi:hypothetical protein